MKYLQTYFECFRASGINTIFKIARFQEDSAVEIHLFDHVDYDGVSALAEMSRQFPAEGFKGPSLALKEKPGLLKRISELVRWYIRYYPFMPSKWKCFDKKRLVDANGVTVIDNWSPGHPVSVNTRLLFALDMTSRNFLVNPKVPRVWMTPVGLYNEVRRDIEPMNRVSFIDIEISDKSTLSHVQRTSKNQLQDLNYWGTILTMYSSVMFGKRPFIFLIKYLHHFFRRTGTFSNMGEWTIPGLPENEWWGFTQGCVALMTPVDSNVIIINGRLGLSAHFHPSIGLTDQEAQNFVSKWKENFFSISSQDVNPI